MLLKPYQLSSVITKALIKKTIFLLLLTVCCSSAFAEKEAGAASDTTKWKSHQIRQSLFSPIGAPPVSERLVLGESLTPSDSAELQEQKRFSYHLLSDFVSYISGQPVEYLQNIEEIVDEEAIVVNQELFFNASDSNIQFLEELKLENNFRRAATDEEVTARMKKIENIVPFNYTPEVRNYIERYGVRYQSYTSTLVAKSNEYFPLFEKILAEYDMPEELKYLVVVESAFKTKARSHAGAVGLWQFMPRTGKIFGLNQNMYIDERMNPTAATIAACKYLKYLHDFFGDWELAIAAYNCGPGNVKKAMRRSGKEKFWDIYYYLPKETRAYVPLFVTYAYLFNYAEEYGMVVEDPIYAMEYDTVYVSQHVNLDRLADELRICPEDLKAMNPEVKRGVVPNFVKEHPVRIPKNRASFFWNKKEEILLACQNANYKSQVVASSKRTTEPSYKTKTIRHTTAQSYQRGSSSPSYKKRSYSGSKSYHTVRKGETLSEIAENYGISLRSLRNWNGIYGSRINIGQKLVMYNVKKRPSANTRLAKSNTKSNTRSAVARKTTTTSSGGRYHTVEKGDTLWGIANGAGITVTKLKSLNNLRSDKLQVGQRLRVL